MRTQLAVAAPAVLAITGLVCVNPGLDRAGLEAQVREVRPYIFTQVHRDSLPWWNLPDSTAPRVGWSPQRIELGARIQIQLPGQPT